MKMERQRRTIERESYYETIAQNVQRGDPYIIKFKGDPVVYQGIPVLDFTAGKDGVFTFRVAEPEDRRGVQLRDVQDIEQMEGLPI